MSADCGSSGENTEKKQRSSCQYRVTEIPAAERVAREKKEEEEKASPFLPSSHRLIIRTV